MTARKDSLLNQLEHIVNILYSLYCLKDVTTNISLDNMIQYFERLKQYTQRELNELIHD